MFVLRVNKAKHTNYYFYDLQLFISIHLNWLFRICMVLLWYTVGEIDSMYRSLTCSVVLRGFISFVRNLKRLSGFLKFQNMVKMQFDKDIKQVQTDWGGEYRSFTSILAGKKLSIVLHALIPRSRME